MYERRHFFEDECERLPTSLEAVEGLLVNANETYSNILSTRFPSFEHVGSPLAPSSFLQEKTIKVALSRTTANEACSGDEDWMEGLSVADVMRQFGVGPNAVLSFDVCSEHREAWSTRVTHRAVVNPYRPRAAAVL